MSDIDDFAKHNRTYLGERKQYQFEDRVIRKMLGAMHGQPGRIIGELSRGTSEGTGITFPDFHAAFTFPISLTAYKLRRVDFIKALRRPEKTPLIRAWANHCENYEGSEYIGMFYESIGDKMPILLMHNCDRLPLVPPFWRCQKAMEDGTNIFFEPMEGAFQAFLQVGWGLEDA